MAQARSAIFEIKVVFKQGALGFSGRSKNAPLVKSTGKANQITGKNRRAMSFKGKSRSTTPHKRKSNRIDNVHVAVVGNARRLADGYIGLWRDGTVVSTTSASPSQRPIE